MEFIHGLHNNPTFKSQFIEKRSALLDEARAIAKDYGIEEAIIEQASGVVNRKELNDLLREYFPEEDARNDLRTIFQKVHGLDNERAGV